MRFQFAFKNMATDQAFVDHLQEKITHKIGKYTDEITTVSLVVEKCKHDFRLAFNLAARDGMETHTNLNVADLVNGLDMLMHKIEHQASKHKEMLKNRNNHFKVRHLEPKAVVVEPGEYIDAEDVIKYEKSMRKRRRA